MVTHSASPPSLQHPVGEHLDDARYVLGVFQVGAVVPLGRRVLADDGRPIEVREPEILFVRPVAERMEILD
jgi:hypothetical protein